MSEVLTRVPRLGFLGVGWIGRHRLEAIAASGAARVAAIADPAEAAVMAALDAAPGAVGVGGLDELLEAGVDAVVIATPSALHAEQAVAALERGVAVFCQKPLGRTAAEVEWVVAAARAADRLLGVDLSYRHTAGMRAVRERIRGGELGEVFAVDLVFHNAYGPDKPWFYDSRLSGGGCVMDLGIHLVDLALWALGEARVEEVTSRLFAGGTPVAAVPVAGAQVGDYAVVELRLEGGAVARLACSWRLPAGCDAVIEATFYGTRGGASFRNVGGSFYDFRAELYRGTGREVLVEPPDAWGGRAAVAWAEALAGGIGFDPEVEGLIEVARTLDRVYGR
jgi:predicted dehydrogenase